MTTFELKEKLDKALSAVEKRKATIEKHKKQADKKRELILQKGWELDRWLYTGGINSEAYWANCEYENKLEDIEGATKKLREAEIVASNWQAKLDKQISIDLILSNEIPEAFKQARETLINEWVASDIKARDFMKRQKVELSYSEFRKMYRYTAEEALNHPEEKFRKIEAREADLWLINLYQRVKDITGEVTDCSYLNWGGKCLDGFVVGKNGKAKVETIGAGGYNIQRYHLRVLVHKM